MIEVGLASCFSLGFNSEVSSNVSYFVWEKHWMTFLHVMHSEGISSDFWRWFRYPRKCEHPDLLGEGACGCSICRLRAIVRLVFRILVPAQMNANDTIAPT